MAMIGLKETAPGVFASWLARFSGQGPAPGPLRQLRDEAFAEFAELGFPSHRHEGWRQTNVGAIANQEFTSVAPPPPAQLVPRLRGLELPGVDWADGAPRLVFVNGEFAPGLSRAGAWGGCRLRPLSEALAAGDEAVLAALRRQADFRGQAFVALNYALLGEGAVLEIPRGVVLERPVSILYVTLAGGARAATHPHTLVLAGRESQATVVETHAGFDGETVFTNAVTTLELDEGAVLEHARLQQEGRAAFHITKLRSHQGRASRLTAHSVALGGALTRNNVHAILAGEGAECTLNGLLVADGDQHVDNSTVLDHAQPLCTSREYYKGVLDGKASGVFNGRIVVRPGAQHTDAIQSSKNLLLSDGAATINAQPQLEIYADDVRCTHGATVGQLDSQALFYLRSRALGLEESRRLLIYAFAADVLERLRAPGLREQLEAMLFLRWNQE